MRNEKRINRGFFSSVTMGLVILVVAPAMANCDFTDVDAVMQERMTADSITNAGVLIGSPQGIWYKHFYGNAYGDSTVIPLASASKLLSGIRILQLADRHIVDLDAPVTNYLFAPTYPWSATAAPITLRQMFSHTAGYGRDADTLVLTDHSITLAQSVQQIASDPNGLIPQTYAPAGTQFSYAGISMQIGGEVAERASGVDWQQGWRENIGDPLCIDSIDWQGLGATLNYHIGGGAQADIEDYARVLAMLAADGVGNGRRILSSTSINLLKQTQIGDATIAYVPAGATGLSAYSIGAWIEDAPTSTSTDAPVINSIGKLGYAPWVDFSNHTFGIIMVAVQGDHEFPTPGYNSRIALEHVVAIVRAQIAANDGTCHAAETFDGVFTDNFGASGLPAMCPGIVATP